MARLNDQDTRDAEHALRAEIALHLARYARRMLAQGKAYITEDIAKAAKEGGEVDGLTIGRAAAAKVRAEYFSTSVKPAPAIDIAETSSAGSIASGGIESGSGIGESAFPGNLSGL